MHILSDPNTYPKSSIQNRLESRALGHAAHAAATAHAAHAHVTHIAVHHPGVAHARHAHSRHAHSGHAHISHARRIRHLHRIGAGQTTSKHRIVHHRVQGLVAFLLRLLCLFFLSFLIFALNQFHPICQISRQLDPKWHRKFCQVETPCHFRHRFWPNEFVARVSAHGEELSLSFLSEVAKEGLHEVPGARLLGCLDRVAVLFVSL